MALAPFLFIISIHLAALAGFFTFSWKAAFLCLFLHWVTGGVGITLCYHRLLTHRSFMVPKWLEYSLAAVACLACQGGPISWVSAHRLHHAKSDQAGDPHSPLEGFFWAHMGWCLMEGESYASEENRRKLCPDMIKDPVYIWMDRFHIGWTLLLAVGLYFWGGWSFVVWGIFVRTVLVYHSTWLVNSAAHIWGYRTYMSGDRSTNCWWVALLSYGEGWHNNHHAFQYSARHGLKWWEVDTTYMMIQLLEAVGLAKAVRIPSSQILSRFYAPEKNPSSHVA
ncbi:MAG: acyl-CoA desaturase [Omnitrophica bacterium GWA2_52_8]|nr:MAG: acyl-CoA desaturase [Omnitrophica bacterium GWA2_52_8]